MKKIIAFITGFILLALFFWYQKFPLQTTVTINDHTFTVKLAVTENAKRKGLGGISTLDKDHGMLFLMSEPAFHGFWMKDMKFPLDFIWINDKMVVDITQNVPNPIGDNQPVNIKPQFPADKVLELNAGEVAKYSISIGNTITVKN